MTGEAASLIAYQAPLRILVLEDSPEDAELCQHALESYGLDVRVDLVTTPDDLRRHLEGGEYDLILTDYNLPQGTGLDAIGIVGESRKDIPVILVTGSLGEELAVECLRQGAADYVLKDRLARLPIAVEQVLAAKKMREQQQRDQESLRQAHNMLDNIVRAAPVAIISLDREGRVTSWNQAAERIFGWEEKEIVGQPPPMVPPDKKEESDQLIREGLEGQWHTALEVSRRRKDGSVVEVSLSTAPLQDASGAVVGLVGLLTDITERKQLEEQLRQAQKMEAVGRLAGGVAHDFNNHLMVIQGYAELLAGRAGEDERLRQYAEEVLQASGRAGAVVRQLLAFSRKQVLRPVVVDLNQVVAETHSLLGRLLGEDIELKTLPAPGLRHIKADPTQLEQVILNLAVNARDAMPRGGKLTVETANVELDDEYARKRRPVSPGPYVLLAVTDTGTGMDEETQEHIFEPFFTTKGRDQGTGLGLATVYGIVKQSGGHVWVYSEPGQGATFKLYFPSVNEPLSPIRGAKPLAEVARGWETILVVEDEAALRQVTCEFLRDWGYTTLEAANGEEALAVAGRHEGEIHLLLTDVVMPRMSGPQLAAQLSGERPGLKVLFVSGYADNTIVHHGVLDQGTNFLQKPFTRDVLARKVRQVLSQTT